MAPRSYKLCTVRYFTLELFPRPCIRQDAVRIAVKVFLALFVPALYAGLIVGLDYWKAREHENAVRENERNRARCAAANFPYCSYDANGVNLKGCYEKKIPPPGKSFCDFEPESVPEGTDRTLTIFAWVLFSSITLFVWYCCFAREVIRHWGPENLPEAYSHV